MRSVLLAVPVILTLSAISTSVADDLYPPPWRGEEGTTYARWEFLTDDNYPPPDDEFNPYGPAQMEVWPGMGQEWWPEWGGRIGVWPMSGVARAVIPNRPEPFPYKDIWVQVTWAAQVPNGFPLVWEEDSGTQSSILNEIQLEPTNEPPPAGEFWYHTTYLIHLEPNPPFETVRLDGSVMVDEIVIDTICIPEPTTIALVCLVAGLALLRRR